MLVTLKQILELAENEKYAIGGFNTPNLEALLAVIGAAEELNLPVAILHAQLHEDMMSIHTIGPIMVEFAKKAKVPVCVQLDHGEDIDYVREALKIGFTGVMFDGSKLPFEENMANTKEVVSLAKQYGASVEAELGCMGKRENGSGSAGNGDDPEKIYTDPEQAKIFVEETGVDALACSFGTTHGIYLSEPKLDFSVVEKVHSLAKIPVVMHGGSGVSEEDFKKTIKAGVRKINYYTYMTMAGGSAVEKNLEERDKTRPIMYHDIVTWGMQAMKEDCKKAMKVFALKDS